MPDSGRARAPAAAPTVPLRRVAGRRSGARNGVEAVYAPRKQRQNNEYEPRKAQRQVGTASEHKWNARRAGYLGAKVAASGAPNGAGTERTSRFSAGRRRGGACRSHGQRKVAKISSPFPPTAPTAPTVAVCGYRIIGGPPTGANSVSGGGAAAPPSPGRVPGRK